jgi:tetratricopeptide (TPR) repeat protein
MSRGAWILLLGAAALAAAVAAMATRESVRSSEEELRRVKEHLKRGRLDREEALSDLDRLIDRTLDSGDSAFVTQVRLARGRILMDIAAWDRAREDLQVALGLAVLSPAERREVEDDLIGLDMRTLDYDKGLQRVKTLLDRDPRDGSAWARAGELHRAKAERSLVRAREVIESRLIAEDATRARGSLDRLGTMDPTDPRRPAVGHDLAALFEVGEEDRTQQILLLSDEAARENAQARTAFATGLSAPDALAGPGRALAGLFDLLSRAGHAEEAAQLGTCALRAMQARGDMDSVALFVRVLDGLDRQDYACDLARWLVDRGTPIAPELLLELSGLFYRAERWGGLGVTTARLSQIGNSDEVGKAGLYSGLAEVHQGDYSSGRFTLQKYVLGKAPEPFERARAEAWRQIAYAAQKMHFVDEERDALERAILLDPEGSGEALLRLATLQYLSAHGGYRQPEEQWARAMSLVPERTDELLPRWKRIGDLELKSSGLSAANVLTGDAWLGVFSGAKNASTYELCVLVSALLDADQAARAEPYVRRLIQVLPNFVPGLDLAIRTEEKLGKPGQVLELLLSRMRAAGPDARSRAILARFPSARMTTEQRLEFMRADPDGFGRREIARGLAARGDSTAALQLVGNATGANAVPEAREAAAQACLDLGQPQRAFELLQPLGRRATATASTFELYARAAALAGHRKELARASAREAHALLPRRTQWLAVCDGMLRHGAAEAALPLLRRLDGDRRSRGGEVLVRLAWTQLVLGDQDGLSQTIERAAAFDTGGGVDLVGVLACARSPTWSGLSQAVAALKKSAWRPTRLQAAALSTLEGRGKAARAMIDAALSERPVDPLWVLADAFARKEDGAEVREAPDFFGPETDGETARFVAGDRPKDPRLVGCILLALDTPIAAGWVATRIGDLSGVVADEATPLWPTWLAARVARSSGEPLSERRLLENLVRRWPGFGPAWDRLEQIARALRAPEEMIENLREQRLHALGERSGTEAERYLDIARIQRRGGDLDGALETARRAAERDLESGEIRAELGRIHALRGEWKEAVDAGLRASLSEKPSSDARSTGALIQALAAAGLGTPPALPVEARIADLEALEKRCPDDPRVPVARAHLELELDPRNPTLSVARAYARLERFLATHKDVALENLCIGAESAWTDLLLSLDPKRAQDFLEGERGRDPAALEPWIQLGRVHTATAAPDQEVDDLDLVRRMAPIPRVLREHARVRLAGAPTLSEINALMRNTSRAEGRTQPDAEMSLHLAEACFDLGPKGLQPALILLKQLPWAPDLPSSISAPAALLRAEVLVARGQGGDATRASQILADLEGRIADPYRATLALACASLASLPETTTKK